MTEEENKKTFEGQNSEPVEIEGVTERQGSDQADIPNIDIRREDIDFFKFIPLDIEDPVAVQYAMTILEQENPVPICMGPAVYALIAKVTDKAIRKTLEVKERSPDKPFALLMDAKDISRIVDLTQIPAQYHVIFTEENINELFGAKGFMRIPIQEDVTLPKGVVGPDGRVQVFTFKGDDKAFRFQQTILDDIEENGVRLPTVLITSYNISGNKSITEQAEASELTTAKKMLIQIDRPEPEENRTGSYTIIGFSRSGIEVLREGTGYEEIRKKLHL